MDVDNKAVVVEEPQVNVKNGDVNGHANGVNGANGSDENGSVTEVVIEEVKVKRKTYKYDDPPVIFQDVNVRI